MPRAERRPVALVTGAARRIGAAIALELARTGFDVAIHHRASRDDAEAVAEQLRATGVESAALQSDLAEEGAPARLITACEAALGPPSCLVNNASLFEFDSLASLTRESWHRHFTINLEAPVLLAQVFARRLPSEARGTIVNIVDQRAWKPTPSYFSYSLSKSALWSATRMLAQALAPRIRVNAVGPGPVIKSIHQSDNEFEAERSSTLLGRGTAPEEIAKAVRFILDAPAMTGQMIALDGGQHLTWPFEPDPSGEPRG
jgi:NAD(P)-dependent dehydrogenase (short-subunit alcohol dehydrogenase family)